MKAKHNKEIESLLAKYENAATSKEEEKRLATLLQQKENKMAYPEEAALFAYFQNAKNEATPASFVSQMLEKEAQTQNYSRRYARQFSRLYAYAAMLLIAIGSMYYIQQYQQKQDREEARIAYIETKKALFAISKEMNKATQNLSTIEEASKETQKYINP